MKRLNTFALLFGYFFLILGVAEFVIRAHPRLSCLGGYKPSKNGKIVYELCPGYPLTLSESTISSQGLNDRYFSSHKPEGIFRIAFVGDSESFGWKLGPNNSFPKLLERRLNREAQQYEVMNFSVPGYNTAQEFEVIKEKVLLFNPDMVILNYCRNDTHFCNYFQPEITSSNFFSNRSFFLNLALAGIDRGITYLRGRGHPLLWRLWREFKRTVLGMHYPNQRIYPRPGLQEAPLIEGDPPLHQEDVPQEYWYMLGLENYKIHLWGIKEVLRRKGITLVSSGFFDFQALETNRELGIEYIFDFNELLRKERISYKETQLPEDPHLSLKGHRLIANHIYRSLKGKNLI